MYIEDLLARCHHPSMILMHVSVNGDLVVPQTSRRIARQTLCCHCRCTVCLEQTPTELKLLRCTTYTHDYFYSSIPAECTRMLCSMNNV